MRYGKVDRKYLIIEIRIDGISDWVWVSTNVSRTCVQRIVSLQEDSDSIYNKKYGVVGPRVYFIKFCPDSHREMTFYNRKSLADRVRVSVVSCKYIVP